MEDDAFERLNKFVDKLPAGSVATEMREELIQRLMECWHMFKGCEEEAMEAYKLERMEDPYWDPPEFSFEILRHGGMSVGSSRAERQLWQVNFSKKVAQCENIGYRQVWPRDAPLDVKHIADEISGLIIKGAKDDRLQ